MNTKRTPLTNGKLPNIDVVAILAANANLGSGLGQTQKKWQG